MKGMIVALTAALALAGCGKDTTVERKTEPPVQFSGGVLVTDAWGGEWNLVTTFTDCLSGATTMVEDVVDLACPGDTLRFAGSRLFALCGGTATDTRVDVDCAYTFDDGDCSVRVEAHFTIERDGDAVTGSGSWSSEVTTTCSDVYPAGCESISITGTRLSTDTSPCATRRGTPP